ncbi:uncharacterized protein [Euwallacea fornicatus]|uniref:uncharacterized protein isoform X1 n=2 Tax=Euwallacea fornicatus TaxID=995702 RepID=UPI00338DCBA3
MFNVPPKFYQLCRLCLSGDNDDRSPTLSVFDKEKDFPRKILYCLSISANHEDLLPKIICLRCSEQLESFTKFKETATKSEEVLNNFILYTKQLQGNEEDNMRISEDLLAAISSSMLDHSVLKAKQSLISLESKPEPSDQPDQVLPTTSMETGNSSPPEPIRHPSVLQTGPLCLQKAPPKCNLEELSNICSNIIQKQEPLELRTESPEPLNLHSETRVEVPDEHPLPLQVIVSEPPPKLSEEIAGRPAMMPGMLGHDFAYASIEEDQPEPADLSTNKKQEISEDENMDARSESSSSTDPDRLEVDMSQATEDMNSSSTASASPPPSDRMVDWPNLYHSTNGFNSAMPALSGEASQLLRKLITCRKLGMTITPSSPKVLNYALYQGKPPPNSPNNSAFTEKERSSGRRKQSYPTKANNIEEMDSSEDHGAEQGRNLQTEEGSDSLPDFTGSAPWITISGKQFKVSNPSQQAAISKRVDICCTNCRTQTTTIWRRNVRGEMVCNACGLYFKLHGIDRPLTMRRDTIHTRRRRPKGQEGRGARGSSAEGKKKLDYEAFHKDSINSRIFPEARAMELRQGANVSNLATEKEDTDSMLSALRRQLQPHLVMALRQGTANHGGLFPQIPPGMPHPTFLPTNKDSPGGSAHEVESDEESIADLPLNLVATQLAETESH